MVCGTNPRGGPLANLISKDTGTSDDDLSAGRVGARGAAEGDYLSIREALMQRNHTATDYCEITGEALQIQARFQAGKNSSV